MASYISLANSDVFRSHGLTSHRKAAAFGFNESAFIAPGQVAKDRAVQGCVRCLTTGARPIGLGFHRCDQLLSVHRVARFTKNLQGRSDAAQSLFASVGVVVRFHEFGTIGQLNSWTPNLASSRPADTKQKPKMPKDLLSSQRQCSRMTNQLEVN